jgi:hypothetical protein
MVSIEKLKKKKKLLQKFQKKKKKFIRVTGFFKTKKILVN